MRENEQGLQEGLGLGHPSLRWRFTMQRWKTVKPIEECKEWNLYKVGPLSVLWSYSPYKWPSTWVSGVLFHPTYRGPFNPTYTWYCRSLPRRRGHIALRCGMGDFRNPGSAMSRRKDIRSAADFTFLEIVYLTNGWVDGSEIRWSSLGIY